MPLPTPLEACLDSIFAHYSEILLLIRPSLMMMISKEQLSMPRQHLRALFNCYNVRVGKDRPSQS